MRPVPESFQAMLDSDERILWHDNPKFVPFLASGLPFLLFGLGWGLFDVLFMMSFEVPDDVKLGLSAFFVLHMTPTWLSISNIIRLVLVYSNTHYAYTTKRVMMSSGFLGTDFKTIDYDQFGDAEVTVNPVEHLCGAGTIRIFTGHTDSRGQRTYDKIIAIASPYQVFKHLKQVALDIKTDYQYPNALRPAENPGYQTQYTPRGPSQGQ